MLPLLSHPLLTSPLLLLLLLQLLLLLCEVSPWPWLEAVCALSQNLLLPPPLLLLLCEASPWPWSWLEAVCVLALMMLPCCIRFAASWMILASDFRFDCSVL